MTGQPTAWVDDREWVVNQRSSDKYNALLGAVNRDDPSVRHLAGYAAGGRPTSREYAAAPMGAYSSGPVSASVDTAAIEAAMERGAARGLAGATVTFQVDHRTIHGIITDANRAARRP